MTAQTPTGAPSHCLACPPASPPPEQGDKHLPRAQTLLPLPAWQSCSAFQVQPDCAPVWGRSCLPSIHALQRANQAAPSFFAPLTLFSSTHLFLPSVPSYFCEDHGRALAGSPLLPSCRGRVAVTPRPHPHVATHSHRLAHTLTLPHTQAQSHMLTHTQTLAQHRHTHLHMLSHTDTHSDMHTQLSTHIYAHTCTHAHLLTHLHTQTCTLHLHHTHINRLPVTGTNMNMHTHTCTHMHTHSSCELLRDRGNL